MDIDLATKINLKTVALEKSLFVWGFDNYILHRIAPKTKPIYMIIDNHHEDLSFNLIHLPQLPLNMKLLVGETCYLDPFHFVAGYSHSQRLKD